MKILLVILFLFFGTNFISYCQKDSDFNEIWTIAEIGMGKYHENITYSTIHDTIINLNVYKAIYQTNDSIFSFTNSEYYCAYRIVDKQWYFIPKGEVDEYLLYDFNLKVNDTVYIDNPWVNNGLTELIALEIDSINLNEAYHKKVSIGYYDGYSKDPHILEYWIEGIGCSNGLFYSGFTFFDLGFQLLCYHKNGELVYLNSPDNSCGYLTTGLSKELPVDRINIYPNPAKNILNIENNNRITQLEVFDILGCKIDVVHINLKKGLIKIDINNYPKYFMLRIITKDFQTIQKIVRE